MVSFPPANLELDTIVWPKGKAIHRIHLDQYQPAGFNPGVAGNARFSPIKDANGNPIPTIYGGANFECAAMETIFHDVPFAPGLKTIALHKLEQQVYSVLLASSDLTLVDLSAIALRKIGIKRLDLIDTEKDEYPLTRQWAAAIHRDHPHAHGLAWMSRQDDRSEAIMLFGDRTQRMQLAPVSAPMRLLTDANTRDRVDALAIRLNVSLVPGRTTS